MIYFMIGAFECKLRGFMKFLLEALKADKVFNPLNFLVISVVLPFKLFPC